MLAPWVVAHLSAFLFLALSVREVGDKKSSVGLENLRDEDDRRLNESET